MTLEEFRDCVDLYSADLSRWPPEQARAALRLMEESAAAKDCFEQDLRLMDLLQDCGPAQADLAALENRIMQAVAPVSEPCPEEEIMPPWWRLSWLTLPGGGLLAAAFFGFMIGLHSARSDLLLDPVFYDEDQIIHNGSDFYDEGVF